MQGKVVAWHGGRNTVPTSMVVGIYNASGTVWGEMTYVFRKLVGRGSCALCDITHGWSPVMRPDFKQACEARAWSFDLLHIDEATAEQLAAAGPLPAVICDSTDGWVRMLGPADFEALGRNPNALLDAIESKLAVRTPANGIDASP